MNQRDLDKELIRLFAEQRLADEASAPGFRELLDRARAGTKGPVFAPEGKWAWRAAVAAAASLALATGLYLLRPPPEPPSPSIATTLAAWKAPTDVLLQTPGVELLGRLPVLLPVPLVPGGEADKGAPGTREATPRSTQTKVPQLKGVES
jgi:hypothetical protein